jgi:hypothetical protein
VICIPNWDFAVQLGISARVSNPRTTGAEKKDSAFFGLFRHISGKGSDFLEEEKTSSLLKEPPGIK